VGTRAQAVGSEPERALANDVALAERGDRVVTKTEFADQNLVVVLPEGRAT
jgi:hypothetical protein